MKFSILIPCYNISQYLEQCLESVIWQTYKDWEIILVDDGSTDGTTDIIKCYAEKDNRIKPFSLGKNEGVAVSRNILLRESTGDYIIFLDGDDWWKSKTALEEISFACRGNSMDIVVFQHEIVRRNGNRELRSNNTQFLQESFTYTGEEYFKNVLGKRDVFQWFLFLYAFKKQLWTENNIKFNPNIYALEDGDVLYRVILSASKLVVIHKAFYQYRVARDGSLTHPSKKFLESMMGFSIKNIAEIKRMPINEEIQALLCDNFSCAYFAVLYSVNCLKKDEAKEIFPILDKNKDIMIYTQNKKYVFISKIAYLLGVRATSRLWHLFSRVRRYLNK